LADAVGPNAGLLVDSFHVHTSGTTFDYLAKLPGSRIVLVHINDAPDLPLPKVQDSKRVLPGEGVIDVNGFVQAIGKTGYNGPLSLEVFSDELKALPPPEAARKAAMAARRVLPDLFK
jgi:sugar phosphate isomerase/epimerase